MAVEYRMYFGDRPATQEELDRVDEIVVEQEVDMAWEARIRLTLCLDDAGHWRAPPHTFAPPFSRVRVELNPGSGTFVPLIDGPVAGYDTALDSQPGRSSMGLVVRDDSVLLNRDETNETFEDKTDSDIAREVFTSFAEIGEPRVQSTPGPARPTVRRGTAMQFLRELAHPHEFHAYVLPGAVAGRSVGCFLPDPAGPSTLPPLVLVGSHRNLVDVEIQERSERPGTTRAVTLRIGDQQIVQAETRVQDLTLMRPLPSASGTAPATRQVAPEDNDREDPAPRAEGAASRAAYAYEVKGRVVPGCYGGVLTPYQRVTVQTGDLPLSGDWLLTKVTHRISPSVWTQEFEGKCDSQHAPAGAEPSDTGALAAAGLAIAVSASLSIF